MNRPTQQEQQAEELQLLVELLATLRAKRRRTAAVLSVLRTLYHGTAMQLPPDGISAASFVAAQLAGDLASAAAQSDHPGASAAVH
ncbi:hypothetical protein SAMN05428957_10859 [Oryzisolibacter propanilivorax]|uniref:Uncharacterized protein n=1 Tax=Oryzisolibacter propanilivorax TaxID=1527607 RepID=A0A1G9U9T0_9BURK|nr:hypothetical protein [Oryzisolibacter propanilivorax]SDM56648.1 hypothetical protein SAMN05428957_10859 [Oryzisolibacter propanilivorax]